MDEFPPFIEVTPNPKGFWCKSAIYFLYVLLSFAPFLIGVVIGYGYNIWIGIAFFLFLTLISGIVSSKMRIASIPFAQREMDYSTMAIVKWFVAKNWCI